MLSGSAWRSSAVAVFLAVAAGCGGGSLPAPAKGKDAFVAPDIGTPAAEPVAVNVGTAGGQVAHKSGAKLKVPAGALPADVELTMEAKAPPAEVAAVGTPLGPALQLGPEGQTFLVPVQIAIPLDPALLAGVNPAEMQIVLAPGGGGEFTALDTTYDSANQQLLAETSHFSIAVPVKSKGPPLKFVQTSPLPAGKTGEAYGPLKLQIGGGKAPYTFSLAGGNLPTGLALAPDGAVSGTPEQAGSFAFSVKVKDGGSQSLEKALAVDIDGPPNPLPVVDSIEPAGAKAGGDALAIAVSGKDFVVGAQLTVNGKGIPTVRDSATLLKGKLTAAHLAVPAVLKIAAVNPPKGGGASAAVDFAVTAADADTVAGDAAVDDAPDAGSADSDDTGADADDAADATDAANDASPACVPSAELCDGKDNDCNGKTDDNPCCTLGAGAACDDANVCTKGEKCTDSVCGGGDVTVCTDDGNPCTDDACDPKNGCAFPANNVACNDGKACTQGDKCVDKACAPGKDPLCNDGNACTLDTCSETDGCKYLPTEGACDDGDGCTAGETCAAGLCGGATKTVCDDGKACTLDACDPKTGKCAVTPVVGCGDPCVTAADCKDDGNPCTLAECATGACAVGFVAGKCDDGDPCSSGDNCNQGLCAGNVAACNDGNACTADACGKDGKCTSTPANGGCEDGDLCTILEVCKDGKCSSGGTANCDDGNNCTDDGCDPKVGCQHPDSITPCTDDDPCTTGDACKGGTCKPAGSKDCSDTDDCTLDSCDSKSGACVNQVVNGCGDNCAAPSDCKDDGNACTEWLCAAGKCKIDYLTSGCDDGDACSEKDTCGKGACKGSAVVCADTNPCTDAGCDKATGCVFLANTATCTDGQVCTVGDGCKDKACVSGAAADCDDQNECTFDTCDSKQGCTHAAAGLGCSDGNPCTLGDNCDGTACKGGTAKVCDDGNGCTSDACDAVSGKCVFAGIAGCGAACTDLGGCPDTGDPCVVLACNFGVCAASDTTATCDDGSVCTANDACAKGKCVGKTSACDDANGCTADVCDAKAGCTNKPQLGPCEDGDLCTVQDNCVQGAACKAGLAQQCDDGNPCTADGCDPKAGCQFAPTKIACSDGDPCTLADACSKGACLPGDPSPCDDGNGCTADSCDSASGACKNGAIKGCGDACQADGDCADDGNPCTAQVCANGKCGVQPASGTCDDGNPCTTADTCAASQCGGQPTPCSDGNPCTDDSCDPKTGCVHAANSAPCSLGNACSSQDACKDKTCTPGAAVNCDDGNACTLDTCDPDAGCGHVQTASACDDGNPCTAQDECGDGACMGGVLIPCDDGSACTADNCDPATGKCVFAALKGCGTVCAASKDCQDDGNPCTQAVCAGGTCVIVYTETACNDGDPCSAGDTCMEGQCTGTESACDDGNACTADACDAKKGCSNAAKDGACDDGSVCTVGDACKAGVCKGSKLLNCDDGDVCTSDACDVVVGCTASPNTAPCSDGNPCTAGDACAKGNCQAGKPMECDDGKPCTLDVCDAALGKCKSTAVVGCGGNCAVDADCPSTGNACAPAVCQDGACALSEPVTACDDGNACTAGDKCGSSLCVGSPADCDDGSPCTLDGCDPKSGCTHTAVAGACDDNNACTAGDACDSGKCVGGKAIVCLDANPCTDDGCKPASGCVALPNAATCDDGNLCTVGDKCLNTYCGGGADKNCDDGNPCTKDACSTAKGCISAPAAGPCDDGNACTEKDACVDGQCAAGAAKDCSDGNVCTKDSCDIKLGCAVTPTDGNCDDSNACTVGDFCQGGNCLPGQGKDCNDQNPCTADSCSLTAGCLAKETTDTCDDGDACTVGDQCGKGKCVSGPAPNCDDGNPCTDDSCDKAVGCKAVQNSKPCSDGNACTTQDVCVSGKCQGGAAPVCNDGNPCTADSCDENKGCVIAALDVTCTDDNACTTADNCKNGDCIPGAKPNCDDGNPCTDDSCDKVKGCVTLANAATCTDNTVCTEGDGCKDAKCVPGKAVKCDDKNPCTDDACDAVGGCGHVDSTKACDDGNACTKNDTCSGGKCATVAVNCDDGNVCTGDDCDPAKGCVNAAIDVVCSDGNACTAIDQCAGLQCVAGATVNCDDKNVCTDDSCDKAKGCVNAPNAKTCDDGTVCTTSDGCAGGKCGGTAVNCDDNKPCTDDSCDKVDGCQNVNSTKTCTDNDACTAGDACKDGACLPGAPPDCDDKNACTDDSCDKAKGCQHANNTAACSDGDACTTADQCAAGSCSGTAVKCDDGNACTDDTCDKAKGCGYAANGATNCNDGNACTTNDACAQGNCTGTAVTCNDNVACTVDSCVPATGCKFAPNNNLCNDNESCTTESCDAVAGCKTTTAADNSGCTTSDPCVTTAVCLSGKCAQKPIPAMVATSTEVRDGIALGGSSFIVLQVAYPTGQGRVARIDGEFNTDWEWTFPGNGPIALAHIDGVWWGNYFDKGTVVLGDVGTGDRALTRLDDSSGKVMWTKHGFPNAMDVVMTTGGFMAIDNAGDGSNVYVADTNGNKIYTNKLPGQAWSIAFAGGSGQFVAGTKLGANGKNNLWYARINNEGNLFWQKTYTDTASSEGYGFAVGNNFTVAGVDTGAAGQAIFLAVSQADGSVISKTANLLPPGGSGVEVVSFANDSEMFTGASKKAGKWTAWLARVSGGQLKMSTFIGDHRLTRFAAIGDFTLVGGLAADNATGFLARVNPDGTIGVPACTATNLCTNKTCNDNVPCTLDSCDPKTGCVYTPDATQCDDGNLCTANTCDAVKGCTFTASTAACDDKNPCTDDTCDLVKGCANAANSAPCEDGNACTVGDLCGAKACVAGAAKNCEDGIACTSHACDTKTGCKQTANDAKCDDGKLCTADTCDLAKGCTYAADAKVCNDANACTDDTCDNAAGCTHVANAALCDDGNACTVADACKASACKPGPAKVCDDNVECTADSCDAASGCKITNKAAGTTCTPSTSCSDTATCGGDGNCYDGPSKYYKSYVDNTKGGPWGARSLSQVYDGSNSYMNLTHDSAGNYTGIVKRRNMYGQEQWTHNIADTQLQLIKCTPWANYCYAAGRGSVPGRAHVSRLDAATGNPVAQFGSPQPSMEYNFGGNEAVFTDVALVNGETQYPYMTAWRQSGGQGDAYMLYWGPEGNSSIKWSYEGPGDERATGVMIDSKNGDLVVGYTNSKGGGGYDGFWDNPGNLTFQGLTYGGPGDEFFYGVMYVAGNVWAYGTGSDSPGGGRYVLLVRLNGQVVKKINSLNAGTPSGGVTDGSKMYIASGTSLAAFDGNGDILWQNNYNPIQPLNFSLLAVTTHSTGLLAGGTGFNTNSGATGVAIVRTDWNGIANCTDKNQCATLTPGQCDDKIACTYDSCDVVKGCIHTSDDNQCNDGNPCTLNQCSDTKGCIFPQNNNVPCNDNSPCTIDTCDIAAAKCVFTLDVAKACDDNNACNTDNCDKANGCYHGGLSCEDNNPCTDESAGCDPKTGCSHVSLDSKPCDDGVFCTVEDFCVQGKCTGPSVCDIPANGNLVLHLDARVTNSLVMSGKKVATWQGVKGGQTQLSGAVVFGDFNTPEVVNQAINGRTAIDLTFAHLDVAWPAKDEWTAIAVFKNDKNPSGQSQLMLSQPWTINIIGVDCTLSYYKPPVSGASSVTPTVPYGQPTIVVLKVTKAGATMAVFGPTQAEIGSIPLPYAPANAWNFLTLKTVTLGALQLYDKALTSAEQAAAVIDLKQDWGFVGKCKVDSDCNDGDGCTKDTCDVVNGCTVTPITTTGNNTGCDDGNACSAGKNCNNGTCVAATFKDCDDNNPCTADSCNPYTGNCVHGTPTDSPKCSDGNACTNDSCAQGSCIGMPKDCDDKNQCTADTCDPGIGCINTATTDACNDGNPCTGPDACANKVCTGVFNTAPCDDFNPCTVAEKCKDGACSDTQPIVCPDDGNACTVEECTYWSGCKIGSIKACNDGNPCTDDNCNVTSGKCEFTPNAVACNDGNPCSLADSCYSGKCWPGNFNECSDGDLCTDDKCIVADGSCTHNYNADCFDGNWCTENDLCIFGACLPGSPKNCDDGNACTIDSCNAPGGDCLHVNMADNTPCSDGIACTLPDLCAAGSCKPGPKVCDYAVNTLGDGFFKKPDDPQQLDYPEHGGLREAIFDANYWQNVEKLTTGKDPAVRTVRFFVEGKLTLSKPMDTVNFGLNIDAAGKTVIIDGGGKYRGLTFNGTASQLKGIKVQNAYIDKASEANGAGTGAAILLKAGKLTLTDCNLYGGTSEYGGGGALVMAGTELTVNGGTVVQCVRKKGLGATGPNGTILYGDGGGAIRVEGTGSKFNAVGVRFDYNSGPGPGGSVWCGPGAACDIRNSSFYGGIAHSGAVGVAKGGSAILSNVTINANENYGIGTGVYSEGALILVHTTISGNSAIDEKTQPALYVDGPTTIVNSVISEAGATKMGLDCVRGPSGASFNVIKSIISVTSDMKNWGPLNSGKACTGSLTAAPAQLIGQKLIGNARVMFPMAGSPIIDKASLDHCLSQPIGGLDILGAGRPKGNGCDIGSVELP